MKVQAIEKFSLNELYHRCYQTSGMCEENDMSARMTIEFYYLDEDGEEHVVGTVEIIRIPSSLRKFNNRMLGDHYDTLTWMDDESQELSDVALVMKNALSDVSADMYDALFESDLYYISRVHVEKQFRGCGIGSNIMYKLYRIVQMCAHEESPVLLLRAFPTEETFMTEEWKYNHKRLLTWYEKVGFQCIDDDVDVMVQMK